jgi:hypothetical protein
VTCAEARALFSALVDDELTTAERAAADTHLAGCAECRRELERLSRTVSMVRALPAERAPVGFVDRVTGAARPVPWTRRFARRLFVPLRVKVPMEVAAVLVVATSAVWLFQRTPALQQASRHEAPAPPAVVRSDPPPVVIRPPASPPAPATSSRDAAPPAPTALKDEATSRGAEADIRAKEKAERQEMIVPREMETRRTEQSDAAGAGAAPRTAEAPARGLDSLAKQSAPSLGATAARADVSATWRVEDRPTAARELDALVTRLGGSAITRRTDGGVEIAEFSVPRNAYEDLTNVLEWFGRLTVVSSPRALPPTVRVSLRITG